LAFSRTPNQVLNIAYGNIKTPPRPGGFFPAGMNGTIRSMLETMTSAASRRHLATIRGCP